MSDNTYKVCLHGKLGIQVMVEEVILLDISNPIIGNTGFFSIKIKKFISCPKRIPDRIGK